MVGSAMDPSEISSVDDDMKAKATILCQMVLWRQYLQGNVSFPLFLGAKFCQRKTQVAYAEEKYVQGVQRKSRKSRWRKQKWGTTS